MNPGKRFEHRVKASLDALGGYGIRLEDGGQYAHNRQLADFLYIPPKGGTLAIECKAVKGRRLPLSRLQWGVRGGQMDRLLDFNDMTRRCRSIVAINFYGDDYRRENLCYLVPALFLIGLDGKSISIEEASNLGVYCPKESGHYDMGCLDGWLER